MSALPVTSKTTTVARPGQPITVQDFLRGLKKRTPAASPTYQRCAPTSEVPPTHKAAGPTKGSVTDISTLRLPNSLPVVKGRGSSNEESAADDFYTLRATDVGRTYTKRHNPAPQPSESFFLLCTQKSMSTSEQHNECLDTLNEVQGNQLAPRKGRKPKTKKPLALGKLKSKRLRGTEKSQPKSATTPDTGVAVQERSPKKRKRKRRAPVNELALVRERTFREDCTSDYEVRNN